MIYDLLNLNLGMELFEQPDFDFEIKFLGGDINLMPGVEKMIDVSAAFMSDS